MKRRSSGLLAGAVWLEGDAGRAGVSVGVGLSCCCCSPMM